MAFINIADPDRRKEIVQEYLKTRNAIREKSENNKESNLLKEKEIEERAKPIVTATEKSAEKITSALKENEEDQKTPYEYYLSMTKNKDKYFSIYRINAGTFKLGNTDIQIDEGSNIHISGKTYEYTSGLWDLLMLNKSDERNYTEEDLNNYKEIVEITKLIENPHTTTSSNHYRSTLKYKFLLRLKEKSGTGIILPGDINSLKRRLQLVCGERAAGNIKATTPEIVAILDELLQRNYISKQEYNVVCEELEC